VIVAAAGGGLAAERLISRAHAVSLAVNVPGRTVHVRQGTTLGELMTNFALRPHRGDVLDVNGRPVRRGAVLGKVLVDGRPAALALELRAGDSVTVVDGHSRREALTRRVTRIRGGMPTDPQFNVAYARGEEIVVRGALSHELVSAHFRPDGPATVRKVVALTFDDGPWPSSTGRILNELRRLHVRATFFVIGYLAQQYPALVRRELRLGMVVGNHSYNHPQVPPFDQLPVPLLRDEIALSQQILTRLGIQTHLFRPPGGSVSPNVVRAAAGAGDRVVLWSVDPTDWQPGISAARVAHRVLSSVKAGSIVILHDGGGDRSATLAALPRIVKGIRARGLRFVVL
jgi:peptidoglycan-N-acetylglucosamine deacetylase